MYLDYSAVRTRVARIGFDPFVAGVLDIDISILSTVDDTILLGKCSNTMISMYSSTSTRVAHGEQLTHKTPTRSIYSCNLKLHSWRNRVL
jgi:hypothetical protein